MRSTLLFVAVGAASLLAPLAGSAQAVPFFQQSGNSFDPEIDVVESGALLDATATVSADRKYVTLTMRPQLSTLIALREFVFQNSGAAGFVGQQPVGGINNNAVNGANPNNAVRPASGNTAVNQRPAVAPRPVRPTVLDRPGITRLSTQVK